MPLLKFVRFLGHPRNGGLSVSVANAAVTFGGRWFGQPRFSQWRRVSADGLASFGRGGSSNFFFESLFPLRILAKRQNEVWAVSKQI